MKNYLLILVLLLQSCNASSKSTGNVAGKVNNEQLLPIAGAQISISSRTVNTGTDGSFYLKNIASGIYSVKVHANGYVDTILQNISINTGTLTTINLQLRPAIYPGKPMEISAKRLLHHAEREDMSSRATGNAAPYPSGVAYDRKMQVSYMNPSTESYKKNTENDFRSVKSSPLSTLSVDVDRASYSNVRRFLNQGQKPPADAVRVEEMINYFDYDYPQPAGNNPIAINTEMTECPWNKDHKLLQIGIQAKKISTENLPASNLVFLLDVSGSMEEANKLPLVKSALKLLVDNLRAKDRVSIVVYAGNAGLVLPPTSGANKTTIIDALDKLNAGGSTAGGEGILLAYKTAEQNLMKGGNNRIILATDGDFNVGVSNDNELERLIEKERNKGIFLTCLGFGMGNYKDSKMEVLADKGNGNYGYIDNIQEARKMLVSEFGGTLFTVAKDVKAQIEFNPAFVQGYRLIGYENRLLNAEDFKDDKKDAAEMGSGHSVTILYEIIPTGVESKYMRGTDPLKYQAPSVKTDRKNNEVATVKFRYKEPLGSVSKELIHPISDRTLSIHQASQNVRFSASVAMFGMLLTNSPYKGTAGYTAAINLAENARGVDREGYKAEYIRLMKSAQ